MALWILSNTDTFRSTAVVFGVSKGIVHFHYPVVIEALRELAPKYIKWPSVLERDRIKRIVYEKSSYPGFVGALDGILFRCYAPAIQPERYFERHQAYSVNVQAICDHNLLYRDLYVGEPGSVHDSRVFQRSPLYNRLLEGEDLVRHDEHTLADGGYECMTKVLTPFRDLGHMTPRQRRYNFKHSSTRMVAETSFGRLRSKMRRLLKLYIKRFEYLIDHIVSSFMLHNFIILGGREADGICILQVPQDAGERNYEDFEDDEDAAMERVVVDNVGANEPVDRARRRNFDHPLLPQAKAAGRLKREAIADLLFANNEIQ